MGCNFINVGSVGEKCKENFSGVGSSILIFTQDDIEEASLEPQYSETTAGFTPESFVGLKVCTIKMKSKSGKVSATSNPNAGGFSNVYTGVVANDMDTMSAVSRVMNNRTDWGALIPAGNGSFYVLYDKDFDIDFSMESDTGDAPDSDHGHTVTITQSPMLYPLPKWTPVAGSAALVYSDASEYTDSIVG